MDVVLVIVLILLSMAAGQIGSVFGLGGGVIVVPVLTILFDIPMHEAVAVSLVAIVAISATGAASHVRNGIANVRVGLRMEVAAAAGAVIGAVVALYLQSWILMASFALVMIYSAVYMFMNPERTVGCDGDDLENGETFEYRDPRTGEDVRYRVRNIRTGMLGFLAAGISSPLSGVGGGVIKVPIMNTHMDMPIKAATATSSLVIGITAFAGAAVYLISGTLDILVAAVVIVGAFIGSRTGVIVSSRIDSASLKRYFSVLLIFLAVVMILKAGGVL